MRILYLTGDVTEHTTDMLYNGLVEWYGHDNVIDFPYRDWHHVKEIKDTGSAYLFWCSCLDENVTRKQYSFDEIVQMVNNGYFDIMISSIRAYDIFSKLKTKIRRIGTIIVNGEDLADESYLYQLVHRFHQYWDEVDMVLQREYKHNIPFDNRVVPFQFSCPLRNIPNFDYKKDKEIDVFCCLGDTHPFRRKLRDKISQISGIKSLVSNTHFSIYEYFRLMNNSKICIVSGGLGWETTHYTDVPSVKSMLLAQHPRNAIHSVTLKECPTLYINNFKDKESAIFYKNDLSDIEELIRYYLDHDKEREEITRRGYEHLMNNLTSKCMAEYVIRCWYDRNYWRSLI